MQFKNTKKNNIMYLKKALLSMLLISVIEIAVSQTQSNETVLIETTFGKMKIKLFNETKLHKANFLKLVNEHFYDSLLFHRVIEGFMIQGGDPYSKHADAFKLLGDSDLHYTIPAEFNKNLFHKKGMLCAARNGDDVNPTKASSAVQFYIVQGKVRTDEDLRKFEKRINKDLITKLKNELLSKPENSDLKQKITRFKDEKQSDSLLVYNMIAEKLIDSEYEKTEHYTFSKEQQTIYKTIGGTPHLDTNYTVFGEVIEGLEVIDKIAQAKTNKDDRPLIDLRMKISIIK